MIGDLVRIIHNLGVFKVVGLNVDDDVCDAEVELEHPGGRGWYRLEDVRPHYVAIPRKLSDIGAKTISQAKENIVRDALADYQNFGVVNAIDLKASGRWIMRRLVKMGLARPMFAPSMNDRVWSWVVTREPWSAELVVQK